MNFLSIKKTLGDDENILDPKVDYYDKRKKMFKLIDKQERY